MFYRSSLAGAGGLGYGKRPLALAPPTDRNSSSSTPYVLGDMKMCAIYGLTLATGDIG